MGDDEGGRPPGPSEPLVALARFSGHGLTLAISTGMFLFLGWWVDGRLGTTPILTILGAFLGAGAGFYSLLRDLMIRPEDEGGGEGPTPRGPDGGSNGGKG
jgi:hypothetical protein